MLTGSTKRRGHAPPEPHEDLPRVRGLTKKIFLNQLPCPFERRLARSTEQSEPVNLIIFIFRWGHLFKTDLRRNVCNRSGSNTPHAMNSRISRSCCFGFLINWARWRKDMFKSLRDDKIQLERITFWLTQIKSELRSRPCHGSSGSKLQPAYKKMGHWSPLTRCSPLFSRSLVLGQYYCWILVKGKCTHSGSDQLRLVGQRRAPVHSWWNPRSSFTFRARGGFKAWPFGVIHSRMAPFKLFVSSPRAPEAPLRS